MKKASSAEPASPSSEETISAATAAGGRAAPLPPGNASRSLWLWVAAGFLLLAIAWAVLFSVARSAKIESVPLPAKGGGTR